MGNSQDPAQAWRWTEQTGMEGLGWIEGGNFSGQQARGVSTDGSVIVGFSDSAEGAQAFRWTADLGMVGLGDLDGGSFVSRAYGVSGDGSVVVGQVARWFVGSCLCFSCLGPPPIVVLPVSWISPATFPLYMVWAPFWCVFGRLWAATWYIPYVRSLVISIRPAF